MSSPSPRFLATWPPKRATAPEAACWYCAITSRHSSASSCCESGVEPTKSQNRTVRWRRSPAEEKPSAADANSGGAGGFRSTSSLREPPHLPQKLELDGFSALHFAQCFTSAFPHFAQK